MRRKWKYYLIRLFIIFLLIEIVYLIYSKKKNYTPVAVTDEIKVYSGAVSNLDVLMNDIDKNGDSLFIDSIKGPYSGKIINKGEVILYYADSGFTGVDSLRYWVSDGKKTSNSVLVTINVYKEKTICIEAEFFNHQVDYKPFIIKEDNEAFGKKFITSPENLENSYSMLPQEGRLIYLFNLEDDTSLEIWMRIKNDRAGFWLIVDGEEPKDCFWYSIESEWIWKNSGFIFDLAKGEHKIELVRSKSNTNLDMILLTNKDLSVEEVNGLAQKCISN